MKKIVLVFLVSLAVVSAVNAQDKKVETGKICFLRSTGMRGAAVSFKTFIDGNLYCKLNNKRYSVHEVPVGKHDIFVQFRGLKILKETQRLEIQVVKDRITYVQFFLEDEFLSLKIFGQEISEDKARVVLIELKEDTKCK